MATQTRTAVAAAVAMVLITAATPAASDGRGRIVLSVENRCRMPQLLLEAAQQKAATFYDEIGVDLVWFPAGVAPPPELTGSLQLRVVLPDNATEKTILAALAASGRSAAPVGIAPRGTSDVYVFCGRITSRPAVVNVATVLGRALAHEIGHQVLPGMGHSDTGIMRGILDYGKGRAPGFTDTQTQSIQALLVAHRTRP